jgi:hypothetical protein
MSDKALGTFLDNSGHVRRGHDGWISGTWVTVSKVNPGSRQSEMNPADSCIIPPPELRDIIYKTSWYALNKGQEFEKRLREKEASNYKFSFLNPNDPYYSYYQKAKEELLTGQRIDPQSAIISSGSDNLINEQKVLQLSFESLKMSRNDLDNMLFDFISNLSLRNNSITVSYADIFTNSVKSFVSFSTVYESILNKAQSSPSSKVFTESKVGSKEIWIYPKVIGYIEYHSISLNDYSLPKSKLDLIMMNMTERNLYFNDAKFDRSRLPEE